MRLIAMFIVAFGILLSACAAPPPVPSSATAVQRPTAAPTSAPAAAPSIVPQATAAPTTRATAAAPASQMTPSGGASAVALMNIAYNPNSITVRVGTTVNWTNNETSAIQHTVTSGAPNSPSGAFDSGNLNPGQSFQFTFKTPGTFTYFCRVHGAAMTGTVVVTQ